MPSVYTADPEGAARLPGAVVITSSPRCFVPRFIDLLDHGESTHLEDNGRGYTVVMRARERHNIIVPPGHARVHCVRAHAVNTLDQMLSQLNVHHNNNYISCSPSSYVLHVLFAFILRVA